MENKHLTVYTDAKTGSMIYKTTAIVPVPPIGTEIWIANHGIYKLESVKQNVDGYAQIDANVVTTLYVRKIN